MAGSTSLRSIGLKVSSPAEEEEDALAAAAQSEEDLLDPCSTSPIVHQQLYCEMFFAVVGCLSSKASLHALS